MDKYQHKNKAVILGSNYYIGLNAMRALGKKGIEVIGVDHCREGAYALASKYCSKALILPHYKRNSQQFIRSLIGFAEKEKYKPVLIPCADPYVEIVDEFSDELKKHFLLPPIEKGLAAELLNKDTLHGLAQKHGVKVPETIWLNQDDILEKVEKEFGFPCLLKPANSHQFVETFREKMFIANNKDELYESIKKVKKEGFEAFVQRIIPGPDNHMHTFDCYIDSKGNVTHYTTCQKQRQYPINFGASVYTKQKYFPKLYEIGAKFLTDVGYRGFAEIEFKKDEKTGDFYLIEVNVRLTNFDVMLQKIGLNMPYIMYRDLVGSPLEPKAITEDTNIHFWYSYEDILAIRNYLKTGQLSKWEALTSLKNKKAYAIWSIDDPMPFVKFSQKLFRKVLKKVKK
ncbi:carboxylate--amine ligase [Proteinivorax hydrogeniformans]|uniref:Carboxylate--amine ligase n=1 Tax=Proteinivorax hydrogeniformans TaxID=1826727 RepID=A0AAU8HQD5_9FIRM